MFTHLWKLKADEEQTVLWGCEKCLIEVRFVKEGFGEPVSGTDAPPATAEDYTGACDA